jgi:hypothetical protein
MSGVGLQARPNRDFLNLPLKTSLKGWHHQWFYCENYEPSHASSPIVAVLATSDERLTSICQLVLADTVATGQPAYCYYRSIVAMG